MEVHWTLVCGVLTSKSSNPGSRARQGHSGILKQGAKVTRLFLQSPLLCTIYMYISPDEWATTKQACRDELVVYLCFSSHIVYILLDVLCSIAVYFYVSCSILASLKGESKYK